MTPTLKILKTRNVKTPSKATPGSACYDIYVPDDIGDTIDLISGSYVTIPTGLRVEIPAGWVMLINSRSGMGFKHRVRLSNAQGVIDSDYRDEIMVQLYKDPGPGMVAIAPGERVAQFWLQPVHEINMVEVESLDLSGDRGGGLGSSGGFGAP